MLAIAYTRWNFYCFYKFYIHSSTKRIKIKLLIKQLTFWKSLAFNLNLIILLTLLHANDYYFIVTVFQETSYYRIYRFVGWGCPVLMTLIWAIIMAFYYHPKSKCVDCLTVKNTQSQVCVITIELIMINHWIYWQK